MSFALNKRVIEIVSPYHGGRTSTAKEMSVTNLLVVEKIALIQANSKTVSKPKRDGNSRSNVGKG